MLCGKIGKTYCFDPEVLDVSNSISFYIIKSEKPAVVETGPSSAVNKILSGLDKLEIEREKVGFIFITHIHLDHGGGAGTLSRFLPNAKIVCHPKAVKHLVNPEKLWIASKSALGEVAEGYGKPEPGAEDLIVEVEDGMKVDLGNDEMLCILTPGHAPHHASFFLQKDRVLFPGDSAGVYAFGKVIPTTPPPFDLERAINSLDKMIKLKPDTIAYTHFGFAENGHLLKEVREKLLKWSKIASETARTGGGIQEFHSKLEERDRDYRELYELTKDNMIISGFHILTLKGLLEYARST